VPTRDLLAAYNKVQPQLPAGDGTAELPHLLKAGQLGTLGAAGALL